MASSDIILSEEEKEEALKIALERKKDIVFHEQKVKGQKLLYETAQRPWTYREVQDWMRFRIEHALRINYTLDDQNHAAIKALCLYYANDPKFEELDESFSLNKGLMLCGNVGTGKTTLMRIFSVNNRAPYTIISCRKLADMYSSNGPETLHQYSRLIDTPSSLDTMYRSKVGICFDDLGTERMGKHYGSDANVMEQLLLNRYDHTDAPWHYTHLTTNLNAEEIEKAYGTRCRSRCREMFNQIVITGADRRR